MANTDTLVNLDRTNQIDGLVANGTLTRAGANWLKLALDPFHDFQVKIDGLPDRSTEPSAVLTVQASTSISRPAHVAAGNNWDVWIGTFNRAHADGTLFDFNKCTLDETLNNFYTSSATQDVDVGQYGYVSAVSVASGVDPLFSAASVTKQIVGLSPITAATQSPGPMRVIAGGFEVTNTTAPINRAGTCTICRVGSTPTLDSMNRIIAASDVRINPVWYQSGYVSSGDEIARVPNFIQYAAEHGAYIPFVMSGDNPIRSPTCVIPVVSENKLGTSVANLALVPRDYNVNSTSIRSTYQFPMMLNIARFTGLSSETTLTITAKWILEVVPPTSSILRSLIQPPAPYDPLALELYTRTVATLPPGCFKGDNDAGDWFREAARTVGKVATALKRSPLYDVMPAPLKLATTAAGQLTALPSERLLPRKKKKQTKTGGSNLTTQAKVNVAAVKAKQRKP